MEFDLKVYCKECGSTMDQKDKAFCETCIDHFRDACSDLEKEKNDLKDEIGTLESQNSDLEDQVIQLKNELDQANIERF